MSERSNRLGRALGLAGLVIAGVFVTVAGIAQMTFGCFMVTDPACPAEATAKAVPYFFIGAGLLVGALLVAWRGRRRDGDDSAR